MAALILAVLPGITAAEGPRVLPPGELPGDRRLEPLKDLDGYFPFEPPAELEVWRQRAAELRRRLQVSQGLWPLPAKTPLNAVIHGRIEQPGYTIEKVYFESFPGFYVTGNLYRPATLAGLVPGVLCPHGHWSEGRFHDAGEAAVRREIVQGAERFEDGGRSPLQARCVQLARMGCVVFHYDMIGYADSGQISFEVAHRFAKQRPEMNRAENWGLFSPQAETHLQSVMGLQTWNSIRALDFLESLSEVDPQRLAVTGASGGGTQTFVLSTLDPRISVSFPAVMVSTAMQGGCTCENACLLRVGAGNVDYAATFAPKPQALTAANDWTREMETKGFPQLKQAYQLYGAADNVRLHPFIWFGHNYNFVSRSAMYDWFNRHLKLGQPAPVVEEQYPRLEAEQLTVWDDQHPRPAGGEAFERALLRGWKDDADRQLIAAWPRDEQSLSQFRQLVGGAVDIVIGRRLPPPQAVEFQVVQENERDGYRLVAGLVRNRPAGEELPTVLLIPQKARPQIAIWLSRDGKSGLFDASGEPRSAIRRLLDAGITVLGADLLYQGEFLTAGQQLETTRRVANPREAAAYTFGYNPSVFAQRVHDVLSLIAAARDRQPAGSAVSLVGLDGSGPWAAAALAQAGDSLQRAAIDTGGFRFAAVSEIHAPDFLPGGAKYWDLPGMVALAAPLPLWLADGPTDAIGIVRDAYGALGRQDQLELPAAEHSAGEAAVAWLIAAAE